MCSTATVFPSRNRPMYMPSNLNSRKRSYDVERDDDDDDEVEYLGSKKRKPTTSGKAFKERLREFLSWMKDNTVMTGFIRSALSALNIEYLNAAENVNNEVQTTPDEDNEEFPPESSRLRGRGKKCILSPPTPRKRDRFVTLARGSDTSLELSMHRPGQTLLDGEIVKHQPYSTLSSSPKLPSLSSSSRRNIIKHSFDLPLRRSEREWVKNWNRTANSNGCDGPDIVEITNLRPSQRSPNMQNGNFHRSRYRLSTMSTNDIEVIGESPNALSRRQRSSEIQNYCGTSSSDSVSRPFDGQSHLQSPCGFGTLSKSNSFTTNEVIRIQEKEQYKMLLQQFTVNDRYQHAMQGPELKNAGTLVNAEEDIDRAFTMEKIELSTAAILEKYRRPCQLTKDKQPRTDKVCFNVRPSASVDEVVLDDDDDDEPLILETKQTTPRSLPTSKQASQFFSLEWIQELKRTVDEETEERIKIVSEQEQQIKEYQAKRAARYAEYLKREKLKLSGPILETVIVDKEAVFPEITPEMDAIIDNALSQTTPDEVLSKVNEYQVLRKDMDTLSGLNWLNDEVINFYMALIVERSKSSNYPSVYAFSSFFYPSLKSKGYCAVRRWTRKVDIFSYDINLVPLHLGVHWCLSVIDHRYKKLQFYDSMGGTENCLETLRDYMVKECLDKKKQDFDLTGWALEKMEGIPPQLNGSDCGMFTLKYAEYITRDARITFSQQNMHYFRRRMVYEIMTRNLL